MESINDIITEVLTTMNKEWACKAMGFVSAACVSKKTEFIVLCTDEDGQPQGWRNMEMRPTEIAHELSLPPLEA